MAICRGTGVSRVCWISSPGLPAMPDQKPCFGLGCLLAGAGAKLHDGVASLGLGHQQCAVGAAEHGFGRIAGLDFGDAEADGDGAAVHLGLRHLAQRRRTCSARRAAIALSQSAQSMTNSSPP